MSIRALIFSIIGLIVAVGLSIGGYFLFIEVEEVHKQNTEDLAGFGSKVVPRGFRDEMDGATFGLIDGNLQLAPTIKEKKLSPTEKVILALSRDKDALLVEVAEIQQLLEQQTGRVQELRAYKAENERFAPEQLTQERASAEAVLKKQFDSAADIELFSEFQRQAMSLATANRYTDIMRQYQLILDKAFTDKLLKILPHYGFCLGNELPFITNSLAEQSLIIQALRADNRDLITGSLAEDFNKVHDPCLKQLNQEVLKLLGKLNTQNLTPATHNPIDNNQNVKSNNSVSKGDAIDPTLSPTEQLIQSLNHDKMLMLERANRMKQQLAEQTQELLDLKHYHDETEHYAPLPTLEERNRAQRLLLASFEESRDARRFNSFEKEAMSFAAANHYARFSKQQRLVLTEALKDQIIQEQLPNFGFCFGNGLKFTIDNHQQERQLINALREEDTEYMDPALAEQIATITNPCAKQLEQQLKMFY